jgi:tRNA modification GTPase
VVGRKLNQQELRFRHHLQPIATLVPMSITLDPNDTIVAVASPLGPGQRGIVRLSGPAAISIVLADYLTDDAQRLPPRRARVLDGTLRVDGLRPLLPVMLALWPAPRTYTGQNVAEVHVVGAPPLVNLVLAHCLARGARQAEPGEFTLRAFLSGRIDLTRAEAVLGVIEASNTAQLDAALEQLAGGLSGPIVALRDRLLDVVAHLEANLDFVDEHDVDPLVRASLAVELERASTELALLERRLGERENSQCLLRVVLTGPPNVGKSRLFNALLDSERAIVSSQAGTTRDYISAHCDCDGLTVEIVDTAGAEAPGDAIAREAQSHRAAQTDRADLLLVCRSDEATGGLGEWPAAVRPAIMVWTKADQTPPLPEATELSKPIVTSAATGMGLAELKSAIARRLREGPAENTLPAGTAARCRGSLRRAGLALQDAAESIRAGAGDELIALDLRSAVDELGKVVGAVVTDDILDRIFRRFCIGK